MSRPLRHCGCGRKAVHDIGHRPRSDWLLMSIVVPRGFSVPMSLAEAGLSPVCCPHGVALEWGLECLELLLDGNTLLGVASALDRKLGKAVYSPR